MASTCQGFEQQELLLSGYIRLIVCIHNTPINILNTCKSFYGDSIKYHSTCSFTFDSKAYCNGYNSSIYKIMKDDKNRTSFYRTVIAKHCKNKVVLDIGCGSLCLLGIMAAESNASKVYAIETNKFAFNNAKKLIKQKHLTNKIEIFNAYSMNNDIKLPQNCDIIVHEIIGEIASCEGVYASLKNAKQRFLSQKQNRIWSIPYYIQTYLTPVEFPDINYWQSLDNKIIMNNDCCEINLWNFPQRHYLCYSSDNNNNNNNIEWGLWEDINFNKWDIDDYNDQFIMDEYSFIAQKDGVLGGLLCSIMVGVDDNLVLSSRGKENNCHWPNKLIMLKNKINIKKGDRILVTAISNANDVILKYDFQVIVELKSDI